jgi:hypothetical protein
LFDALLHWYRLKANMGINADETYYQKNISKAFDWHQNVEVTIAGGGDPKKGSLYFRTAYRNDPDFSIGGISRPASPLDTTGADPVDAPACFQALASRLTVCVEGAGKRRNRSHENSECKHTPHCIHPL